MKVKSDSSDKFYEVTKHSCTCPHWVYRLARAGGKCKHIIKAYYPEVVNKHLDAQEKERIMSIRTFFKNGVSIDDAYTKYNDTVIQNLIQQGEICKHQGKFVLLE